MENGLNEIQLRREEEGWGELLDAVRRNDEIYATFSVPKYSLVPIYTDISEGIVWIVD